MGELKESDTYQEELLAYEEDDVAQESVAARGAGETVKKGYVGIHSSGFRAFLLKPELLRAIVDSGFEHPSKGMAMVYTLATSAKEWLREKFGHTEDIENGVDEYTSKDKAYANAYQQNNNLAVAALDYKCVAVARMCVVLAKNVGIRRYQHELQIALQMVPLGRGVGSLASSGNNVTVARSYQLVNRILQHTSNVNSDLDAFAKANSTFSTFMDSNYGAQEISIVKKVIDFSFHDVDELIHLVLLAIKEIDQ